MVLNEEELTKLKADPDSGVVWFNKALSALKGGAIGQDVNGNMLYTCLEINQSTS